MDKDKYIEFLEQWAYDCYVTLSLEDRYLGDDTMEENCRTIEIFKEKVLQKEWKKNND